MMIRDIQEKFIRDGQLLTIPKRQEAKRAIFTYLQERIAEHGKEFTEKEINAILSQHYHDVAILRRYLVDMGYLHRDRYGKCYWLEEDR